MSSFRGTHPDDGALLRYLDGELTARRSREVERHIEACWQCRTEVEELQRTVGDCVRYRKNVLQAHLPEPPRAWKDLYRDFDGIDQELAGRSFLGRWRWAALAAAAAILLCIVWYQWRETPGVRAATLLRRAVAAADAKTVPIRHIRIRTRSRQVTREIGVRPATFNAAAAPIEAMFQSAHYDWDDPLSARAFEQWRDTVERKTDEVTTAPSGNFQIRTTAAEGDLAAATLLLRNTDLRPLEERLEFRNSEWVELSEITEPSTDTGGNVAVGVPVRPAEPSRPAAFAPGAPASVSDELRVLAALHGIGADLGDSVEVKRTDNQVLVSGVGIPAARRQEIRGALDGLPRVSIQFSEPAPAPAPSDAEPTAVSSDAPPGRTPMRIERQLGGRAEFEKFSSRMLDSIDAAMSRIYALRALEQRFPVVVERDLAPPDRRALRLMASEHIAGLASQSVTLANALGPVLTALGAQPGSAPKSTAQDWQSAVEDLFKSGRHFESSLAIAMGVTPAETAASDLPSDLLTALAALRADTERCQRLLSQE